MKASRTLLREPPRGSDALAVGAVALLLRGLVVLWAIPRFPAVEDGRFYAIVAGRIARGLGYTWAWPDGAVTYAAHYPVGYPALLGAAYAAFGEHLGVAMAMNAVLGTLAAVAAHRIASVSASRAGALVAGGLVALHPGLVFYTPALMTEGVTGALLVVSGWCAVGFRERPRAGLVAAGLVLGVAVLVRPQAVLVLPALALVHSGPRLRSFLAATVLVGASAGAVSAPWVARNCERMQACTVSANGGWNLFIGAAEGATGAWVSIDELGVPPACRTVWDEAEKDRCFGREAVALISANPLRWLSLVPAKLSATFDYAGAAGWYLRASNPAEFGDPAKLRLGIAETLWQRLVVLLGLLAVARSGTGPRARALLAAPAVLLLSPWAFGAHLGLMAAMLATFRQTAASPAALLSLGVVFSTATSHAVFFGAGRYSVVGFAVLSALAGTLLTRGSRAGDTPLPKEQ